MEFLINTTGQLNLFSEEEKARRTYTTYKRENGEFVLDNDGNKIATGTSGFVAEVVMPMNAELKRIWVASIKHKKQHDIPKISAFSASRTEFSISIEQGQLNKLQRALKLNGRSTDVLHQIDVNVKFAVVLTHPGMQFITARGDEGEYRKYGIRVEDLSLNVNSNMLVEATKIQQVAEANKVATAQQAQSSATYESLLGITPNNDLGDSNESDVSVAEDDAPITEGADKTKAKAKAKA